jgi:hypothetical protein
MPAASTDDRVVPLSDETGVLDVLTRSVLGLRQTVNDLTRLRPLAAASGPAPSHRPEEVAR